MRRLTRREFSKGLARAAGREGQIEFRGAKGTLYVDWNGYEVVPEEVTEDEIPAQSPLTRAAEKSYGKDRKPLVQPRSGKGPDSTALHARNFLDCVRSREKCNCDIETGHRSTSATLIANIAHKTRSYLEWNREAEHFIGNPGADKHLRYDYRPPFEFPAA